MTPAFFIVVGTRPEAVKLAPVIRELDRRIGRDRLHVCATGQHRDLTDPVLEWFGVRKDTDLALMQPDQGLTELAARAIASVGREIERVKPAMVIVQGDTTTVFAAAFAAAMCGVSVAHVEAGLRTGDPANPFPEEINRRVVGALAALHFAPTAGAVEALVGEGVNPSSIHLTGNTAIDALNWTLHQPGSHGIEMSVGHRHVVVTAHRRESFGDGLNAICDAVTRLVRSHADVEVHWPVHPNPQVAGMVRQRMDGVDRVRLHPAMRYEQFVRLLQTACLIITDSGGVQEEAPTLGVPVLVARNTTERRDGVASGMAMVVGTRADEIVAAATARLRQRAVGVVSPLGINPYGDGRAAERIVDVLAGGLGGRR